MITNIRKAAVLGSGVMGSGIAAHLANIGIQTLLLDVVPHELTEKEKGRGLTFNDKRVRNRLSESALKKLLQQKPAPLTSNENLLLLESGNLEDDLARLQEADWIIEAVVENLAVKKQVLEKVDIYRKPGSIVSSNTSGISVTEMAEGRSEDFQQHFLGAHFFNPPRYLKLLEIIPAPKTAQNVIDFVKTFAENNLGKGVVTAKDTPNFIANRIGTYGLLVTLKEMEKGGFSVGEVDSVTGSLIGRPKSATFRTLDVVGLDTFLHVANNVYQQTAGDEQKVFDPPIFIKEMIEKGWLGSKTGQGFYKKKGDEIEELDLQTMDYKKKKKLFSPVIEQSKGESGWGRKLKTLIYGKDRGSQLLWKIMIPVLIYSAEKLNEIADDLVSIDKAMKWGFGWELGPFEIWDAIGLEASVRKLEESNLSVPDWIKEMLQQGCKTFYKEESGQSFFYHQGNYHHIEDHPKVLHIEKIKQNRGVIRKNNGCSLIDIGDDVALLEFHSPNHAIGSDMIGMIGPAIEEVERNYKGLVIGGQGKNFCVGANLAMILMAAQDDSVFEMDLIVKRFQQAMLKIKYCAKPVVAAPFGMTLGGGAELCLHTSHIQASMETYIGLVETGVGVIPGGGGNKELYIRALKGLPKTIEFDLQKIANNVFETIALAKVSTSGPNAKNNGFLSLTDGISANGDHLLYDAKKKVISLYDKGYTPPVKHKIPVVGETGYATLLLGARSMLYSGFISEHDFKIAEKLAYVIAGGKVPYGTEVDEEYLLNLEREVFLSLARESKSQQRMQYMLMKGKPLRN